MRTYVISSGIAIPANRIIDGKGAIIQPSNNAGRFTSTMPTATATTTVSSGASQGSRAVVVASAASLAVGQWVSIMDSGGTFPKFWAKIYSIAGTTIELTRTLPFTYSGTVNFTAYNSLNGEIVLKNFTFDGSNVTASAGNTGQAVRLLGFERVILENCRAVNYEPSTGGNNPFQILDCVDVEVLRIHGNDNDILGAVNLFDVDGARSATVDGVILHGGHFGFNFWRCEDAQATRVIASGQRKLEGEESVSPARSVRGIKAQACGFVTIDGCHLSDFESPIKLEVFHRYKVVNNIVRNAGLYTYDGQLAISVTSSSEPQEPFGEILGNTVEHCGGVAIGINSGAADTVDANVNVSHNTIRECGRYAIYCEQRKLKTIGNTIENWNNDSGGTGETSAAIYNGGGLVAIGNTFTNSDTGDACFRTNFVANEEYFYRGNVVTTGNPYFASSKVIELDRVTATILNGTTSIAVNHNLVRTPIASEIYLDHTSNPTNDPGIIWVSAISATQITVSCRADPGASMNVAVRVLPEMPFTA